MLWSKAKSLAPARNQTPDIQSVAYRYTDSAIPRGRGRNDSKRCYLEKLLLCANVFSAFAKQSISF
jgi:hypothetical protein